MSTDTRQVAREIAKRYTRAGTDYADRLYQLAHAIEQALSDERVKQAALEKRVAVLHAIAISGIGGSINDFWDGIARLSGDERIDFCQALHQLCEIVGHNNQWKCGLCEKIGARDVQGYYTGSQFFDGTKKDYIG